MITRTAIFEGTFVLEGKARFFELVEEQLAPLWRQFPGSLGVRWYKIDQADDTAHPIVMIQQIDYPSRTVMEQALASPVRDQARAVTLEIMRFLDGTFYHYISEGGAR
ncbi:hypothetical protein [Sphingopyxis sp. FD7]|uniref:hypothetical protein n=1 Tax=Sphingopyxis sp. FD7 TaxID=1914525 RepID=UPI000DC62484|nr:hypothetical protein [Sphingopyxis sp. FD7]BBB14532.1 hypothetical protein SPYCA_3790 [Sphingopyxis sp. FD7]